MHKYTRCSNAEDMACSRKQFKRCAAMHGCSSSSEARRKLVPITKGTILAELERVPEQTAISAVSQQTESEPSEEYRFRLWEMVDDAGQSLSEEESPAVCRSCCLFATEDEDTTWVNDIGETPPICQTVW